MHELISPDSAIDPLVTSQLGVCCKRTGVSHLVVKLHSMYKCRLVLRTPYACNPVTDGCRTTLEADNQLQAAEVSSQRLG